MTRAFGAAVVVMCEETGGREGGDLGGDFAHDFFVPGAEAECREFRGDARDEAAARARGRDLAQEVEIRGSASFECVRFERVAAGVRADALAQVGVRDEAFEVGGEQRVRVRVEVYLDD